jgi:hypothetical protein
MHSGTTTQSVQQEVDSDETQVIGIQRSLGFEIVDYAIDYIGFKHAVTSFKAGDKENYKLEIMIR